MDPTQLDGLGPFLETEVPSSEDAVSTLMAQVLKTLERPRFRAQFVSSRRMKPTPRTV